MDRASAAALCAPTEEGVKEAWRRPASVARDNRPGRPLEEPAQPGRLPKPRQVEPPPEPELGELNPGEEQQLKETLRTYLGD